MSHLRGEKSTREELGGKQSLTRAGDVGGQKTLRSYWRNYFEKTDALIWVVDATDRLRTEDCREELHGLLLEEVCHSSSVAFIFLPPSLCA